jgi:hypothetical protein
MLQRLLRIALLALPGLAVLPAMALDGQPGMHDPSTIVQHDGRYYAYATGGGLPISVSDDGWTWRRMGNLMSALPEGKAGPAVLARGGRAGASVIFCENLLALYTSTESSSSMDRPVRSCVACAEVSATA